MKSPFNDLSSMPPVYTYIIKPVYPLACDAGRKEKILASLMNNIRRWAYKEIGCAPSLEAYKESPNSRGVILIDCTPDFAKKLGAALESEIREITRWIDTPKQDPKVSWKPPRP